MSGFGRRFHPLPRRVRGRRGRFRAFRGLDGEQPGAAQAVDRLTELLRFLFALHLDHDGIFVPGSPWRSLASPGLAKLDRAVELEVDADRESTAKVAVIHRIAVLGPAHALVRLLP